MSDSIRAAHILDTLLSGEDTFLRLDEYLDNRMRYGDSFYPRIRDEQGVKAAEKALSEWVARNHLREFSEAIRSVACGMRDIAFADQEGEYSWVIHRDRENQFLFARNPGPEGRLVVVDNRAHRGCGCTMPDGYEVFGRDGSLGLRAVVLGFSPREKSSLALILPVREKLSIPTEGGYTAVVIGPGGDTDGKTRVPYFPPNQFFEHSLGLMYKQQPQDTPYGLFSSAGGHLDDRIGFPGAKEYLAKHICKLGPYLSAMAKQIEDKHK